MVTSPSNWNIILQIQLNHLFLDTLNIQYCRMAITDLILIIGLGISSCSAQNCWETGCQPNSWATTGCAQYNREERGRVACGDGDGAGFQYTCCERSGEGNGPSEGDNGGGDALMSFDEFTRAVTSNSYPAPSREQYDNFVRYSRSRGQISSKQEAAMALAQFLHESDGLQTRREYACETTQCPDNYRTPDCDAAGQFYFGRGYIQLSWCENYRAASSGIFGDANTLVTDPDRVARDELLAWETAFWFWADRVRNQPGVLEGKFGASTRAINPRLECDEAGHPGPAARFKLYGKVREAFGLPGEGDPSGCR